LRLSLLPRPHQPRKRKLRKLKHQKKKRKMSSIRSPMRKRRMKRPKKLVWIV
jgi:hypothetical protein